MWKGLFHSLQPDVMAQCQQMQVQPSIPSIAQLAFAQQLGIGGIQGIAQELQTDLSQCVHHLHQQGIAQDPTIGQHLAMAQNLGILLQQHQQAMAMPEGIAGTTDLKLEVEAHYPKATFQQQPKDLNSDLNSEKPLDPEPEFAMPKPKDVEQEVGKGVETEVAKEKEVETEVAKEVGTEVDKGVKAEGEAEIGLAVEAEVGKGVETEINKVDGMETKNTKNEKPQPRVVEARFKTPRPPSTPPPVYIWKPNLASVPRTVPPPTTQRLELEVCGRDRIEWWNWIVIDR